MALYAARSQQPKLGYEEPEVPVVRKLFFGAGSVSLDSGKVCHSIDRSRPPNLRRVSLLVSGHRTPHQTVRTLLWGDLPNRPPESNVLARDGRGIRSHERVPRGDGEQGASQWCQCECVRWSLLWQSRQSTAQPSIRSDSCRPQSRPIRKTHPNSLLLLPAQAFQAYPLLFNPQSL